MRELSLFTGAGGGILGTKLLGWTPIGYVEIDDYCQRVLRQRQEDGLIEKAPIFSDIRAFISEGYAERYRGMVDVITAGFPCQPFSVAGKQAGEDDPRNMWPATIECIRMVRPRYAFLENVPGLLNSGYFGRILGDLAESGFDARWRVLSAAEVGAPHKRSRLWIVAHSESAGINGINGNNNGQKKTNGDWNAQSNCNRKDVADTSKQQWNGGMQRTGWWKREPLEALQDARERGREEDGLSIPESLLGRVANGVASRVDRLKAIGNGQVPQCVAKAWELLTDL